MTVTTFQALLVTLMLCAGLGTAQDFKFTARRSTPGVDINCNQKDYQGNALKYCKLCQGIGALADACSANPECKSFDLEGGFCGYLKAAAGPGKSIYTEGFSNYCKVGTSGCSGDWNVRLRSDIVGNDLDCNAKDFQGKKLDVCKIMGDPVKVADACKANPDCKAFVIVSNGPQEGYLKSATGPTRYMESATAYVRA